MKIRPLCPFGLATMAMEDPQPLYTENGETTTGFGCLRPGDVRTDVSLDIGVEGWDRVRLLDFAKYFSRGVAKFDFFVLQSLNPQLIST